MRWGFHFWLKRKLIKILIYLIIWLLNLLIIKIVYYQTLVFILYCLFTWAFTHDWIKSFNKLTFNILMLKSWQIVKYWLWINCNLRFATSLLIPFALKRWLISLNTHWNNLIIIPKIYFCFFICFTINLQSKIWLNKYFNFSIWTLLHNFHCFQINFLLFFEIYYLLLSIHKLKIN